MSKGSGTTRSSRTSIAHAAGDYGFTRLGKTSATALMGGLTTTFSYKPNQTQLAAHVQEYLDTGKFDRYEKGGADIIAKKIAADLNLRGAAAFNEGKYVRTIDGLKVLLSKTKDGKWKANISNASENRDDYSSMKGVLTAVSRHKAK